jgi:hypothetical protein
MDLIPVKCREFLCISLQKPYPLNAMEMQQLVVFALLSYRALVTIYRISQPIRRTVIFSLEILEKNNDECILNLVIYWKKTELLHTKISNHNIIYSS